MTHADSLSSPAMDSQGPHTLPRPAPARSSEAEEDPSQVHAARRRRIGERLDAADSWTPERAAAVVRILAGPSTQPNEADAAILATIPGAVIADPELSLVPIEDRLRHYRWRQVLGTAEQLDDLNGQVMFADAAEAAWAAVCGM